MTSDLTLHYALDEWQGNTAFDGSLTSNHGTISGATWTSGIFGGALNFDGSNDMIGAPLDYSPLLSVNNSETLTCWINPTAYPTSGYSAGIIGQNFRNNVDINASGTIRFGLRNKSGSTNIITGSTSYLISVNTWTFIAATYDGTALNIYKDNIGLGQTSRNITELNVSSQLKIGANNVVGGNAKYFNGLVDEIRIYNRALTSSEILNHYNATKAYHFEIDGEVLSVDNYYDLNYKKKLNQIEECNSVFQNLTSNQTSHIFENANFKFWDQAGILTMQGKVRRKEYNDETDESKITGNDDSILLYDRVYPIRQQLDNVDPTYIVQLLVSGVMPAGNIEASGNLAPISFRIEHDSLLRAIASVAKITNCDWWIDHNPTSGGIARLNYTSRRGISGSAESFTLGDDIFAIERQNKMYDTWNAIRVFGYGDGVNQKQAYTYHATNTQRTILASNLISGTGANVVAVNTTSGFNNSGILRIGIEEMAYTSRNTSGYFAGLSRGTNNTTIYLHNKGIECYDIAQYPITNPNNVENGSSIQKYGLKENAYTDRSLRDQNTIDLLAFRLLNKYKDPSARIKVTVAKQYLVSSNIGDSVTLVARS